jgi:biopolymer transport protein ExbD
MRLVKRRRSSELVFNMTPMIDVTFLLLIFFMTVNQVSNVNMENIPLPKLAGSQDQSEGAITINVDEAGAIIITGREVSLADLATILATELARVDSDPTRLTVVLRANRHGTSRAVNDVVRLLVRMDVTRVRIAVEATP